MKRMIALLAVLWASGLYSAILNVPSEFPTIQSAIDQSVHGDTVIVDEGIFEENINFNSKNIVLGSYFILNRDSSEIGQTIIKGNGLKSTVIFENGEDSTAVLCGLTLTQNNFDCLSDDDPIIKGGGIRCENSHPHLDHIVVENCYAKQGACVYLYNSRSRITHSVLHENKSCRLDEKGGGIYTCHSNTTVTNTIFQNNLWDKGVNIYSSNSRLDLDRVSFHNSGCNGESGDPLVFCDSSTVDIRNCRIIENNDGFVFNYSNVTISNTEFKANITDFTPILFFSNSQFRMDDVLMNGNYSRSSCTIGCAESIGIILNSFIENNDAVNGGGISCTRGSRLIIDHSSVRDNAAAVYYGEGKGGGIYCRESDLILTHSIIENNEADQFGGGLYLYKCDTLIFEDVIIEKNHTSYGSSYLNGGGIYFNQCGYFSIKDVILKSNSAWNGGGFYADSMSVPIQNLTLVNNTSVFGGGGYLQHTVSEFRNFNFRLNISRVSGGGLFLSQSSPVLNNNQFQLNEAENGGGLYCQDSEPLFQKVAIYHNYASKMGGGLFLSKSRIRTMNPDHNGIYLNHSPAGSELYSDMPVTIAIDTFTVREPDEYHAAPFGNFIFNIVNGRFNRAEHDLYVHPSGNDLDTGLSFEAPLKTIQCAIARIVSDTLNPRHIYLDEGIYSAATNGDVFPIYGKSGIAITGLSSSLTFLNSEKRTSVFQFDSLNCLIIENLTLKSDTSLYPGIHCSHSKIQLNTVGLTGSRMGLVSNNSVIHFSGGTIDNNYERGMQINQCNALISGLTIKNNQGGGCEFGESHVTFRGTSIKYNHADEKGGGILSDASVIHFDPYELCSIYCNQAERGNDLACFGTPLSVVLDTFTVLSPTEYHAVPIGHISFDIRHGRLLQHKGDIYVNPLGDNNNSGLSADTPLKTISYALSVLITDSTNPATINLSAGIYSPETNQEAFPVHLFNHVCIKGKSEETTILDAGGEDGIVFNDVSHALVEHLTLRNGMSGMILQFSDLNVVRYCALIQNTTGLVCYQSNSFFDGLSISRNREKGIQLEYSDPHIQNSVIWKNGQEGIFCGASNPLLQNILITQNRGTGLTCSYSVPHLKGVSISYNTGSPAGGLAVDGSSPVFDVSERSNIYANVCRGEYNEPANDIFIDPDEDLFVEVILDTFTYESPCAYMVFPLNRMQFDILHGKFEPAHSDLYVSPQGNDQNSGTTAQDPLKTIFLAAMKMVSDNSVSRTIFLDRGTYSPSANNEFYPIPLHGNITVKGRSDYDTILDAESSSDHIFIGQGRIEDTGYGGYYSAIMDSLTAEDMTLKNAAADAIYNAHAFFSLKHMRLIENQGYAVKSNWWKSSLRMDSCVIKNNRAGIGCSGRLNIKNTIIDENEGQAVDLDACHADIRRCQITRNQDAVHVTDESDVIIEHTTICDNRGNGIFITDEYASVSVYNSIIQGNKMEAVRTTLTRFNPDPGIFQGPRIDITYTNISGGRVRCIDADPLFTDPENGDYSLREGSPCIDAGRILANSVDYSGTAPDMGAWEFGTVTQIAQGIYLPEQFKLYQNYPNPFNPSTLLKYDLPASAHVTITLFNCLGQKVKTLVDRNQDAGSWQIQWSGEDERGMPAGSGLYFCVMSSGEFREVKKMLLVR